MKVGVIGIGAIAQLHIPALLQAGQTIAALCDIDTKKCEEANKTFGINAKIYADYKEMIGEEGLDSVHICTPHYLHAEMICYALDRNINAFCEKPMAISFEQLDEIERSVKRSSALLGVCQQNRYKASMKYIKDYFSNKKILAASGNVCWKRDKAYYDSGLWRGQKELSGGGVVINQALHTLDILQWICGMPVSVIGHTSCDTLKDVIDVEETAFGVFKLPNGGRFILNATNACTTCFPVTLGFESAEDSAVIVGDNIILNDKYLKKSDDLPLFGKEVWGVGHMIIIKDFYNSIEKGEKFELDFYEAKKVVVLLLNLYRSNGEELKI